MAGKKQETDLLTIAETSWEVYKKSITAFEPERGTLHLAEVALKGAESAEKIRMKREEVAFQRARIIEAEKKAQEVTVEATTKEEDDAEVLKDQSIKKLFQLLEGRDLLEA